MAAAEGDIVIEARGIVNRFGSHTVHDGLDFVLRKGEILGLVGGSGSGKSVLLRTLLGLRRPQAGQVLIHGRDITQMRDAERLEAQKQWGVLFQNGALFSGLTVFDNIALPLREHRKDKGEAEIAEIVYGKLEAVGLSREDGAKMPADLSGGMVRRAALARALALDPPLLFLDEPTAGLDPIAGAAFDELIARLRAERGLSLMIITHDLDTLVTLCDRISVLVDNKIVSGTLGELMKYDHPWIHDYFHGPRMTAARSGKAA